MNQPSKESSTHNGAWTRAQTCLHLRKYSSRFAELFDNKASFDRWVRSMSRAGKWVDGKAIQAIAEKMGQPMVILAEKQQNDVALWTRYVVAGRFAHGFACVGRGPKCVCLILKQKRYEALVPPPGSTIPMLAPGNG